MAERSQDEEIVREAKDRFKKCVDWEAIARMRFELDLKFADGDAYNMYQWDDRIAGDRRLANKPCLTINKVQTHNHQILNDMKQNKPGVNVRPVGDNASFEAAQIFQEVVRHIEYISNAESAYDNASNFQVKGGIGYWRLITDYLSNETFDQEIYIKPIRDPRLVYLDPDIAEFDGSDARYGFVFEDLEKDLFKEKYPGNDDLGWSTTFDTRPDDWLNRDMVRVAEYYRKTQKKDKLVNFTDPQTGEQITTLISKLSDEGKALFKQIKQSEKDLSWNQRTYNERNILTDDIQWFKIAGDKIIDRGPWLGKYIPIIRVPGIETVIDGILDRKGHTRSMLDAQRMYNYNTSSNTEFIAVQTKAPWVTSAEAIEGFEEYWENANTKNFSILPYNAFREDGTPIPPPTRPQPPQPSPGYVNGMQIAENELMMASGQYQAQFGENENAKSGVAINSRQRQGDRATFHFVDAQSAAIRNCGKQLIDLIPKIYDTKRVMRISASDGSILNVTIDPEAEQGYQKLDNSQNIQNDKSQQMDEIIFNPNVGIYDVISEVGPSFATKRQEAFNALTQIAAQNKEFMGIAGDILWKVADFPEAQILAERWRRIIPKNITGDALDPAIEQTMHQASDKIIQLQGFIAKATQELADKGADNDVKKYQAETNRKTAAADAARKDYEAETNRLIALGNAGPIVKAEQVEPIIAQLTDGMRRAGEPDGGEQEQQINSNIDDNQEQPPVPGARKAPDNNWYVQHNGQHLRVDQADGQSALS